MKQTRKEVCRDTPHRIKRRELGTPGIVRMPSFRWTQGNTVAELWRKELKEVNPWKVRKGIRVGAGIDCFVREI